MKDNNINSFDQFHDGLVMIYDSKRKTDGYMNKNGEIVIKAVALQRNAQRSGRALVPEDAIHSMLIALEKPTKKEGFTEILEVCE